jgi:Protein of unknown function (DUF4239)
MNALVIASIVFGCSLGAGLLGLVLHVKVPDRHLDTESKDTVKLVMSLIATMAALVLSLLIASANSSYEAQENEVQTLSANIMLLDRLLAFYGPESKETRDLLRRGVVDMHDKIWSPVGTSGPEFDPRATRGVADAFIDSLQKLTPKTDSQGMLKSQAMQMSQSLGRTRLLMFTQSTSSISWPFLTILVFWICMLFVGFGLFARFNITVSVALVIGAISVAGAVFLILELNQPYSGFLRISDIPLRAALALIDQ